MKKHILGITVVGLTDRGTRCGLPERYATCGVDDKGSVYDRERYRNVPDEDVCKSCLKAVRKR
jgi:hypothetical protein